MVGGNSQAGGERSVGIGGNVGNSTIVTGDDNTIIERQINIRADSTLTLVEVRIAERATEGHFPVVLRVPRQDLVVEGTFTPTFQPEELESARIAAEEGALEDALARRFGAGLFQALLGPFSLQHLDVPNGTWTELRVRLIVEADALADIPWELLYHPTRQEYLVRAGSIIRGTRPGRNVRPARGLSPLRVLVADTRSATPPASTDRLRARDVKRVLGELIQTRRVDVASYTNITSDRLRDALLKAASGRQPRPFHVLHLVGEFDPAMLEALVRPFGIRLVLISTYRSDHRLAMDVARSIGPRLLDAGAAAIVAVQATRMSDASERFFTEFYTGLANNAAPDLALFKAAELQALASSRPSDRVGLPTCYLESDGLPMVDLLPPEPLRLTRATLRPWLAERATPRRILAGLVSVMVVSLTTLFLHATAQPAFSDSFYVNTAIAEFGTGSRDQCDIGSGVGADAARSLSDDLVKRDDLRQNFKFMTPRDVGRIDSEAQAAAFAKRTYADVVVYGTLDCTAADLGLSLSAYLSDRRFGPRDAPELVGRHALGRRIRLPGGSRSIGLGDDLVRQVQPRAQGLADLLHGLEYYAIPDWPNAADAFRRAQSVVDEESDEVSTLFLGKIATQQRDWNTAETYYNAALQRNPDYTRARLGLAEVRYHRAIGDGGPGQEDRGCQRQTVDTFALAEVTATYVAVLQAGQSNGSAWLDVKSHYYLGRSYLCFSIARIDNKWADAISQFGVVVAAYQTESDHFNSWQCQLLKVGPLVQPCPPLNEVLRAWAASAHAGTGFAIYDPRIAHAPAGVITQQDATQALNEFDLAFKMSSDPAQKAYCQFVIGDIYRRQHQLAQADAALATAAELDPTKSPTYEAFRRKLATPTPPPSG